ncbi:MAG: 30S ribosome-binding factor RbfA [Dehalococcoidia bacterium]
MSRRVERLNDLLREEISDILRREARDPRLDAMVSITEVEISNDLRHAKVFVSVLGSDEERTGVMRALSAARPFLQRQLRQRLPDLRLIPELAFKGDDSIERGARLTRILDDIAHERDGGS